MTSTTLNGLTHPNLAITNRAVRVSPVRAEITPNPAACVDLEIKLVADHTHAEVTEPIPVRTNIASTLLRREGTLASDVPAPLVQEDLHQAVLRNGNAGVQERLDSSLDRDEDLELHMMRHREHGLGEIAPTLHKLLEIQELLDMVRTTRALQNRPELVLHVLQVLLRHHLHFLSN
ncbi:Os12g0514450 [Oryza sativa Japonica Group]|uniref:Os12g0514450 protein n=1 Tax=Oryza sativa subsp. japonica TaxID=39947 RepID=A0A0P0YB01_ORYSJ|nr:hypothetical protein EE612_059867 [Oryza sativa]BAT17359.1 Os12g0514450 [Oryza sativa Japonica Group]